MDWNSQRLQTTVAYHSYGPVNRAVNLYRIAKIVDIDRKAEVSVRNLGILECSKELSVSVPVKVAAAVLQSTYGYYKGLQSYKIFFD